MRAREHRDASRVWAPGFLARCAIPAAGVLLVLGAAGAWHPRPAGLQGFVSLPWWVMALLFSVTLSSPLRLLGSGRSRLSRIWLTGVPLGLGLFLSAPIQLFVARVVATAVIETLHRRRRPFRAFMETGAVAIGTGTALVVFDVVLQVTPLRSTTGIDLISAPGGPTSIGLLSGLSGVLAALIMASVVETAATELLPGCRSRVEIELVEGDSDQEWYRLSMRMVLAVGVAVLSALLAFLFVIASPDGRAALTLAVLGAVALLVHQVFASLADQRNSLERLYELSDDLVTGPERSDVVTLVLRRSRSLVRADVAEVRLTGSDPGTFLRWSLDKDEGSPQGPEQVEGSAEGRLQGQTTAEPGTRLAVPLRTAGGGGTLVVSRSGGRRFREEEVRLLETVANHASVALRNGQLIERLHEEARHDELTGLPNRLGLREPLDVVAERAAEGGPRCAVMLLDFDGFKAINDTLGHAAGDELLRVLADRLARIAYGRALVARLGGDEFAVLTTGSVSERDAMTLARLLLTAFDQPVAVGESRLRVGGSLGIALGPRHGMTGSDLMRNADIAMYAAKQSGGGAQLFSPDMVEDSTVVLALAGDLQDAIRRGGLDVAVQPIVELNSGGVHSVEVLARWHHPELGWINPETLFEAAERSGLVSVLSAHILDRALALNRRWLDGGHQVRVAVNLATRWLADPELPEQVGQALDAYRVPANLVCLELTERGVIADPRRAGRTLDRLREAGVHLSVDDFGTGYSSMTYLSRLPIDQLKIDKAFVRGMRHNERDSAIVRSIIDLGRNLGLEVVAEGVSDRAAQRELLGMGCRLAQGYLFSRPMDPEGLPRYLQAVHRWVPELRNGNRRPPSPEGLVPTQMTGPPALDGLAVPSPSPESQEGPRLGASEPDSANP
jgi:diguanylate cyclase (GGDEF)-like protein